MNERQSKRFGAIRFQIEPPLSQKKWTGTKSNNIDAGLRTIAQRSIAWRLGIPFQYLRKCPPEIQSVNLNYWIEHEKNEMLFFRMDGREVMGGLPAESSYRLQKVGGEVLGMLN